ncbi:MAG: T9SS type A sorting domain-containing protein [Bacteroidales bacterium]|nr:T9SS type A sorting domain-containing protein [Bacteroidales bacterium]
MKKKLRCIILYLLTGGNVILAQHQILFNFNQPEELFANAGPDTIVTPGISLQLGGTSVAKGGTTPYSYSWQPADKLDNAYIDHPTITADTSMSFYLTVTDSRGCIASDEMAITLFTQSDFGKNLSIRSIGIKPNPASDKIFLEFEGVIRSLHVEVYLMSLSGSMLLNQVVLLEPGEYQQVISISGIPDGVYILRILGGDMDVSKSFIKK